MIDIDLKLFVTLASFLPETPESYQVKQGTTVADLMDELGIPSDSVKLIFVNGKKKGPGYCLNHRDRVGLFPPVGGG